MRLKPCCGEGDDNEMSGRGRGSEDSPLCSFVTFVLYEFWQGRRS